MMLDTFIELLLYLGCLGLVLGVWLFWFP